ncbi:hypothetical protein [Aureibacter tunicatorum]|uniref:Uncharacterized protein n=1 Tax=Aureibacter tunicatorum TaxID=866807 RepID=A0AAE3XK77_9BACT|nr:hypothetical protein [Aureibacter tunicatorum]MDR6239316.1 hypothetical protein [Aureibacter tunicatorum]BDD04760.1 hypothetical protein AUTU_22430 [Aureibacter tunicatorum]
MRLIKDGKRIIETENRTLYVVKENEYENMKGIVLFEESISSVCQGVFDKNKFELDDKEVILINFVISLDEDNITKTESIFVKDIIKREGIIDPNVKEKLYQALKDIKYQVYLRPYNCGANTIFNFSFFITSKPLIN